MTNFEEQSLLEKLVVRQPNKKFVARHFCYIQKTPPLDNPVPSYKTSSAQSHKNFFKVVLIFPFQPRQVLRSDFFPSQNACNNNNNNNNNET